MSKQTEPIKKFSLRIYDPKIADWLKNQKGTNNHVINEVLRQHSKLILENEDLKEELRMTRIHLNEAKNIIRAEEQLAERKIELLKQQN